MSIHAVSPFKPSYIEQNPALADLCLQADEDEEDNYSSTALKIIAIIAVCLVAIGSFFLLGPIISLIGAALVGAGVFILSSCCHGGAHNHSSGDTRMLNIPWHRRLFSFIPVGGNAHVPVGRGHAPTSAPHRTWRDWFSFIPSVVLPADGRHVPVGERNSGHDSRRQHVPVGRRDGTHASTQNRGRSQPEDVPHRSRPSTHVPVGERR